MVSRARPPILPPLLLLACALELPITRAATLTRAILAHSVPAIDSSAVGHRRQQYRGHLFWLETVASLSNNAAQITSVKSPRAPTPCANDSHGVPTAGTSASSVVPRRQVTVFDGENARFQRRSPRSRSRVRRWEPRFHRRFSQPRHKLGNEGTRSNAAPINHGTGGCNLRVPPQARVAQQYSCGDGPSPFSRTCSSPPLTDQAVAGRFEVCDGRPSNTFSDQAVSVGLRCGKANARTPRYFARLDPVFARDSSERSVFFSINVRIDKISYLVFLLQEA